MDAGNGRVLPSVRIRLHTATLFDVPLSSGVCLPTNGKVAVLEHEIRAVEGASREAVVVVSAEGSGAVDLQLSIGEDFVDALVERVATVVRDQLAEEANAARYFDVKDLAVYLCCPPKMVYRLVNRGLPHRRPGGGRRLLFIGSEVDAWIRAQEGVVIPVARRSNSIDK